MSVLGFYACLYLRDEPSYSLSSLLYMHWEPVVTQADFQTSTEQGFIDTDNFFVLDESSAKVALLVFIMSAALCTVCPRQRGCSQKIWVCSLRCFFPSSVLPSYYVVFLSPLICVSSWNTEPSKTFCASWHILICSCHFINCRCPGSKDVVQSPCPVQIFNITE